MGPILQSAFLKVLGWSLIDSLWQMGVVWVLYLAITRSGKKFNAETRHNLALLSLALGSSLFLLTLLFNTFSGHPTTTFGLQEFVGQVPGMLELILPWISVGYLLMAGVLLVRLYSQLNSTKNLSTQGLKKADPEIRVFLQKLAGQMGIKKEIRVWLSELVETPLTVGFWKPVILLPVSIVNNLSLKQTESIILHELYHIQRNDFLMNLLIAVADVILFFNPFARFFRDIIQSEREHRCDDMVLQYRYDPILYAQALLILEKQRPGYTRAAKSSQEQKISIAATGTAKMLLLARVKRMLTGETAPTPISHRLAAYLLPALALGYIGLTAPARKLTANETPAAAIAGAVDINFEPASAELPRLFITKIPGSPASALPVDQPSRWPKPAPAYQNEEINIERDLADVIITEKVEEIVSERALTPSVEYVTTEKPLEYTISIADDENSSDAVKLVETPGKPYPYVPESSFRFKPMADSSGQHIRALKTGVAEIQLARTLSAIDAMDWDKIEEGLASSGEELDVERLQVELKKAVADIDWKSLNADLSKSNTEAIAQVQKYRNQLAEKYLRLEKARASQSQRLQRAPKKTVDCQLTPARPATPHRVITVKKIVNI